MSDAKASAKKTGPTAAPATDSAAHDADGRPASGTDSGASASAEDIQPHAQPIDPDIAELSYEAARDELVSIVSRLEGGSADLEESLRLWGRGEQLAAHCARRLDAAEERLDTSEPDDQA